MRSRLAVGLVVVVMGVLGTGVTTASASTANGSSIGVGSNFVGTYNVSVLLTAGGSGSYTGQITLDSDGTWYGDVLADSSLNSGDGCYESGTWLSSGKVLALSDRVCGEFGTTWMITAGKKGALGSAKSSGYMNAPGTGTYSATWTATLTPKLPPTPNPTSKIGLSPKLADGTVMFNSSVTLDGGGTYTGLISLGPDGSWDDEAGLPLCAADTGSWLVDGKILALSDPNPQCDTNGGGMSWMTSFSNSSKLGSPKKPGYVNNPYDWNATWYANCFLDC